MIVGCLTNIVLDWILIFGFNLGIQGAAIATVTSQALTAILTIGYYISGKSNLRFSKSNLKLDKKLIKSSVCNRYVAICYATCSKFSSSNIKYCT
uniref:Multidrug-efflux transporter n=1 Tax=Clostridioides difficile TaxID=1496 RepID=A0A381I9S7_CLODI|nr:drug/sodium antiporter [Clostridioides difficile]